MPSITDNIASHFEFLGYTLEKIQPQTPEEKLIYVARHPQKNIVVFFELIPSFVLFRVNLLTEKRPNSAMDTFINNANKIFSLSRMYYEVQDNKAVIRLEAVYVGEYKKETFGQFVEIFTNDQTLIYKLEGFDSFLGKDEADV